MSFVYSSRWHLLNLIKVIQPKICIHLYLSVSDGLNLLLAVYKKRILTEVIAFKLQLGYIRLFKSEYGIPVKTVECSLTHHETIAKLNFSSSLLTYIIFNDAKFRKVFCGITVREFLSKLLRNETKYVFISQEEKSWVHLQPSNISKII